MWGQAPDISCTKSPNLTQRICCPSGARHDTEAPSRMVIRRGGRKCWDSKLKYDHVFGINKGFLYVRVKENSTMAKRNVAIVS
jgi:hypothetical protein